jgi:hypothetical protein
MLQDSEAEDQMQGTHHMPRAKFGRPPRLVILTLNVVKGKDLLLLSSGTKTGAPS